jgi:DNA-binding GntR family transcriptional regulator
VDIDGRLLLRDQAYAALANAIVSGELEPGEVLRDTELAVRLGLSRTPVREALTRLADEGLVVTKPNAYTRVASLDDDAALDAAVLNQALHGLAAQLATAAGGFTPDHADHARQLNRAFAAALAGGDLPTALSADQELHAVFVDAAGSRQLELAIARLAPVLRRHALARFASPPGRRSVREHARLIDAAERGDIVTAGQLAEDNWGSLVASILSTNPTATNRRGADHAAR